MFTYIQAQSCAVIANTPAADCTKLTAFWLHAFSCWRAQMSKEEFSPTRGRNFGRMPFLWQAQAC